MIIAKFDPGSDYKRVSGLTQWDYGQKLRIQGLDLPAAVEIHFSLTDVGGESITRVGTTADGVTDVIIPDSMLENEGEMGKQYSVFAYLYLSDSKSGETIKKIEMIVSTRPKPEAWDKPEDQELFHEAIEAVNNAADRAEAAEGNAVQSAESARSDATKTAEDRKAVEELVLMTSDIEEQVDAVKQYKEQAATAATNAALSEQAAKTAKDAAIQAQTAAEIAEDAAEQHAIAAAGDKAEVERMAGQVATDKQTVAHDKADVEKKVSDFELTAQQAVADVNNAGQEQVEHVKSAGETAVKELNAAKDTAAQEINSAKDTSVQAVNSAGQEQAAAVQAEGEKVIDSIPEDYQTAMDGKLDKQQGVENAGKALVVGEDGQITPGDYSGNANMEQLLALAIKQKTEQAEMLHITDSADFPMVSLSGQGYTEQKTTTGAQLFDVSSVTQVKPGNIATGTIDGNKISVTATSEREGYVILKYPIKLKSGVTYYSSFDLVSASTGRTPRIAFFIKDAQSGFLAYDRYTPSEDKEVEIVIYIKGKGAKNDVIKIENLMISTGPDETYEEYTGRKPSPSPDYPQEIRNSGNLNVETQRYKFSVKLHSKNWFNPDLWYNILNDFSGDVEKLVLDGKSCLKWRGTSGYKKGNYAIYPIHVKKGQKITISFLGRKERVFGHADSGIRIRYADGGLGSICDCKDTVQFEMSKLTVNLTKDMSGLVVQYANNEYCFFAEIMVEVETDTGYQNYVEQTVTVTSDRPVSKWDRLELRAGVYGWAYNTINEEYDGTETVNTGTALEKNARYYINSKLTKAVENVECRCNYLSNVPSWANDQTGFRLGQNNVALYMYLDKEEFPDANSVKTWLQQKKEEGKPFRIQYKSEGEEFVPLPEPEQQALKELCTYYPETIIFTDSGLLLQVNYVADTQTYINNNFQQKTELEDIKKRVEDLEKVAIKQEGSDKDVRYY